MAKQKKTTKKAPKRELPKGKRPLPAPSVEAMEALSPQQARFVEEYLLDLNGTRAAIRAGYSKKTAGVQSYDLLKRPHIQAALVEARRKLSDSLSVTLEDIAREMHKLAYSNAMDYMRVLESGEPSVDFSTLTRKEAAAITEISVEDFTEGRGENARDVRRVRYKVESKRQALMDLAKLLGHVRDKVEHSGEVVVNSRVAEAQQLAKDTPTDVLKKQVAAGERYLAEMKALEGGA